MTTSQQQHLGSNAAAPPPLPSPLCMGRASRMDLHAECGHCRRLHTVSKPRQAHILPPELVGNKCPMRVQR